MQVIRVETDSVLGNVLPVVEERAEDVESV
jgi:hypothetical protein